MEPSLDVLSFSYCSGEFIVRDFTVKTYKKLLIALLDKNYTFVPFNILFNNKPKSNRIVVLRHDVDRKPYNSLLIARLEHSLGIRSSYYFRITNNSFDKNIIREISNLNHEIGYHYEDIALAKGDKELAIKLFEKNLQKLREIVNIETICMHGSPLSKYDNRMIWETYNYRSYNIVGEPYFDVNYNEYIYFTDTGRTWHNMKANLRDRVKSTINYNIKNTYTLLNKIYDNKLPEKVIINTHPQRWTNNWILWFIELLSQNIKNVLKNILLYFR